MWRRRPRAVSAAGLYWSRDAETGRLRLCVRFESGGAVVLAQEPAKVSRGMQFNMPRIETCCPDCGAHWGQPHDDGCDRARCRITKQQRITCDADHDCGAHVWDGQ